MADLYGALFSRVLYPGWEQVIKKRPTLARLAYLEKTQWRPAGELRAQQEADLRVLLRHAHAHVPFYRARFEAAKLSPDDIVRIEDLRKLPILSKAEARESPEARSATAPPLPTVRKSTSGSTGVPLVFGYDLESEYWRQAIKLRGYGWAGYHLGERTLHYWGAQGTVRPPRSKRAKIAIDRFIKRERYVDCTLRSERDMLAAVERIRRDQPKVILCYTQAGADLSRFIVERGLRDWPDIPVLCCAEGLYAGDREQFVAAFGPGIFETYGCREVMLIGHECEAHAGLHVSAENLIVEVVVRDGEKERPAEPGEAGDVVITDLHNLGMPFIRYALGDRAVQGPPETCSCGRTLPRLASIEGRTTDTLRDGRGNKVGGLVFNLIFAAISATVSQFQAVQHKDGSITLKLVPTDKLNDTARAQIRTHVAQYLPDVPLRIEEVAAIPLSAAGKRQVVIVER